MAWLAGWYTLHYYCELLGCLRSTSPGSESVHEPALILWPGWKWGFYSLPLALDCRLDWFPCEQTGCKTPHALCVKRAQWITLCTECFHCEDAAFPRHFRAACSGYTLFLWPVYMSAEIKCALSSNLICLNVSWQRQSEVINNIAGNFFGC